MLHVKYKILLVVLAMIMPFCYMNASTNLVVELQNGEKVYFALYEEPELTMSGGSVTIRTPFVVIYYECSDISGIYFTDITTNVEKVKDMEVKFTQIGVNKYSIISDSLREKVLVNNIMGYSYNECVSINNDETIVNLSPCPKGIYIIKIGNKKSIKITKR